MKKAFAKNKTKDLPLTKRRLELGLSVKEIAEYLDVVPQLMTNWFNMKYRPGVKYIGKLAEVLQVTPEWISNLYANSDSGRIKYSNFWIEKKKSAGISNKDIAEYLKLDKDSSTIAKYFRGEILPSDDTIKALCSMFDVDYATGKAEFEKINKRNMLNTTAKTNVDTSPCPKITKEIPKTEINELFDDILRSVYEKGSYEDFFIIKNLLDSPEKGNLAEHLYGIVDYDVFNMIYELTTGKE